MKIGADVIEQVLAHAKREAPIEACGFLMGSGGIVTRALAITNAEQREDHFTFNPEEQIEAYRTAKDAGLDIIGAYHSHPATPARPSAEDMRLAADPALLYVIISLADDRERVRAFRIRNGSVAEESLKVGT